MELVDCGTLCCCPEEGGGASVSEKHTASVFTADNVIWYMGANVSG
jgi:hypothetical protein